MKHKMYNILKVVVFSLYVVSLRAQSGYLIKDFADKRYQLSKRGMTVLTTWASINLASGAGYFASNLPEEKYFYAMNAGWGLINLGIALPSLLAKNKEYKSKISLLNDHTKTEKVFLANAMLDLTYITAGFLLKEVSKNQSSINDRNLCSGFGNSFIVQGSALLVFDAAMTYLNVKLRNKHLDQILNDVSITINSSGLGIKYSF